MTEIKVSLVLEMIDRLSAPMQKAASTAASFPAAGEKVARTQEKIANATRNTAQANTQAAATTDKLRQANAGLGNELDKQVKQNQQLSKSREALSKMAAPAAVAGGGYAALQAGKTAMGAATPFIQEAMAQESAFADVRKVVDFEDNADMEAFRAQIQAMSREIPIATTGLYDIAAAAGQLGVKKDQIDDFTHTVSMMSTAFDMTASDAGDSMAKIANIYKIPINELADIGDVVNHLSNTSAAKANEMVNVMTRVGGIGKEFGLTATQVAALSSTFLSLGKPPEVAATGINALLLKMRTATSQNKDFKAGLKEIGYSAKELESGVLQDAQGTLSTFLDKLQGLDAAKKMNVLSDLFGAEYADDISTLVGGLDEYKKALNQVSQEGNYAFSMQSEFEARAATSANALQLMNNRMAEVKNTVGAALLPAFNEALQAISPMITKMAEWAAANPEIVKGIAMAVMVIGGLSAAIGGVMLVLAPLLAGMALLKGGFGLGSLFGKKEESEAPTVANATAATRNATPPRNRRAVPADSPPAAGAAAQASVAAVRGAINLLRGSEEDAAKTGEQIVSRLTAPLKQFGIDGKVAELLNEPIQSGIRQVRESVHSLASSLVSPEIMTAGQEMIGQLTAPLQQFGLQDQANTLINTFGETAVGRMEEWGMSAVEGFVENAVTKAQGWGQAAMTRASSALTSFTGRMRGGGGSVFRTLASGARTAGTAIMWLGRALMMNPIGLIITAIAAGAYLIYRNWGSIGPWFANMWNRVKAAFSNARAALANMSWGEIVTKIVTFFATLPMRLLKVGADAIGKLAVGIMTSMGVPEGRARAVVVSVMSAFMGLPGKLMDAGKQAIAGLANGIKAAGAQALAAAKGIASDIGSAISGFFQIRSPSRLMHGFGENISMGLAIGLQNAAQQPVAQMRNIAQQIAGIPLAANDPIFNPPANVRNLPRTVATAAATLTTPRTTPVGQPKAPATGAQPASANAPAGNATYNITINAAAGQDPQAIAREVQRQIELYERRKRTRSDTKLYDEAA